MEGETISDESKKSESRNLSESKNPDSLMIDSFRIILRGIQLNFPSASENEGCKGTNTLTKGVLGETLSS